MNKNSLDLNRGAMFMTVIAVIFTVIAFVVYLIDNSPQANAGINYLQTCTQATGCNVQAARSYGAFIQQAQGAWLYYGFLAAMFWLLGLFFQFEESLTEPLSISPRVS